MTSKNRTRIALRDVRQLQPGERLWDSAVSGYGARRQKSQAVAYFVFYRTKEGRQRWHTIGRHGAPWTPDTARAEAKKILGQAAAGEDPSGAKQSQRRAKTVSELCDLYMSDANHGRLLTRRKVSKKASTIITDRGRIERHIKPLLGKYKVSAVTREDVDAFMHDVAGGRTAARLRTGNPRGLANVRGGRGTASRTVGLLGAIFTYAVRHRMRADNPAHGVIRFADGRRERRLSSEEYAKLGQALREAESERAWPPAIAAVRFLAFTGWRSGEVLNLRWSEIDLERRVARLPDTKTGFSLRPLSRTACDLLEKIPGREGLVFRSTRGPTPMSGFSKVWKRLLCRSGSFPADVTPHVLRHSFISLAADLGLSEPAIAALVGHSRHTVTSRYIHSADAVLLAAADQVSGETALLMGERLGTGAVVPFRGRATS